MKVERHIKGIKTRKQNESQAFQSFVNFGEIADLLIKNQIVRKILR